MVRVSIWIASVMLSIASGCSMSGNNAPATSSFCSETQITGTCLVRSYKDNAAVYVTQQQHFFCPASLNLEIISNEPQGKRVWHLNKSIFYVSDNGSQLDKAGLYSKNMMEAILFGMASSTELLSGLQMTSGEPVKVEGQWYIPYQFSNQNTKIELFRNNSNRRYDLATIRDGQAYLQVHSYNYWYEKNIKRQIPRTIDIFDISKGVASKILVMQVDYLSIEATVRK